MKLLFATSIKFPSPLANRLQATHMANAFYRALGAQFYFGGRNAPDGLPPTQLLRIAGSKRSFLFAWRYWRALSVKRITHVYCREKRLLFFLLLYRYFFRGGRGIKFAYEEHARPDNAWWYRYAVSRVDLVVALNQAIAHEIARIAPSGTVIVAPHGVALDVFGIETARAEAREALGLPSGVPIVAYIGSVKTMGSVAKGMETLLTALELLVNEHVPVHLLSLGADAQSQLAYAALASTRGLTDNVSFIGRVSQREVALYQRAADVLALPLPRNEYAYMIPLKVFEYMASGRPIVASDLPSVRQVLHEHNAVLVAPEAPEQLAQGIRRLIEHPAEGERLARQAREEVQTFTWEARADRILAAFI